MDAICNIDNIPCTRLASMAATIREQAQRIAELEQALEDRHPDADAPRKAAAMRRGR